MPLYLNEAAVKFMGLENPIDEEITWQGKKYHVIGVIKDMIMTSPYEPVKQTVFRLIPFQGLWINIRLNPQMSPSESIAKLGKVFQNSCSGYTIRVQICRRRIRYEVCR